LNIAWRGLPQHSLAPLFRAVAAHKLDPHYTDGTVS
jgi:hypothetical protein